MSTSPDPVVSVFDKAAQGVVRIYTLSVARHMHTFNYSAKSRGMSPDT